MNHLFKQVLQNLDSYCSTDTRMHPLITLIRYPKITGTIAHWLDLALMQAKKCDHVQIVNYIQTSLVSLNFMEKLTTLINGFWLH
jgi:hypothetical protein